MKVIITILAAMLITLGLLTSCTTVKVEGSGNLVNEPFEFSDFTEVKVENGFEVELTQSSTFSVVVTADDNVLEHIEVSKSGDTLRIKPKGNRAFRSVTMKAKITMPDLYKIELSSGSKAEIIGFNSLHNLSVRLSDGSEMNSSIGQSFITTGDVDFDLSDGSKVTLSGLASNLHVRSSDGGSLDLEAFSVNNADVKLHNGSLATVNVEGTLNADLSGYSDLIYIGQPTMGNIEVSSDSAINSK
ncbi:head GIN domain-containing protein [Chloroflexota bacterium]